MGPLNFEPIMRNDRPVAVILRSQEQSDHFLDEIYRQYEMRFRKRSGYWSEHKENTAYISRFGMNCYDRGLSYTTLESAVDSGYFIVYFEELLQDDIDGFDESDLSGLLASVTQ